MDFGKALSAAWLALAALLVGCGQTRDETLTILEPGGVAGAVGLGGAAGFGGPSPAGGTFASGGESATGDPERTETRVNVAGRWAMFGFEDPVGVDLRQSEGTLSGTGCGVGTPLASNAMYCSADLTGTVAGSRVKFDFQSATALLPGRYLADLVASKDGKRMAGRFGIGTSIGNDYWVAWLPVPGDDFWLRIPENLPTYGQRPLDLRLASAEANDPSFDPNATFRIGFGAYGIVGDLGAFYLSELKRAGDGVLEAGPVSPTVPELPVYLSFAGTDDVYTSVTARLSNGHTFKFDVLPFL